MTFSPCGARKERTPVDVFINTSKHISPNDKVHSWDLRHRNRFPWLSTYAIEVWASAHYCKYLSQIDKFCKRALHYTSKYTPIMDVIKMKDRLLWEEITSDSVNALHELLPARELGASGKEDITISCLQSQLNALNVAFLIDLFLNLCSYLVLYIHDGYM